MAIDTDDMARMQVAIMSGKDFDATGLPKTAEMKNAFAQIKQEYAGAPEGVMVEIVGDFDWGMSDALQAATEKATGIKFF